MTIYVGICCFKHKELYANSYAQRRSVTQPLMPLNNIVKRLFSEKKRKNRKRVKKFEQAWL